MMMPSGTWSDNLYTTMGKPIPKFGRGKLSKIWRDFLQPFDFDHEYV